VGIIRRQSIQSSILFYIGATIGFISKILIFPNFLTPEEVGLSNILVTNALLYAQFAAMGFGTMTLRFFPYFQDKNRKHHGFLFVLLFFPALAFILCTLLVLIFKGPLLGYFQEKSPMMVDYFWYLIPLAFSSLYFDLLDAYLRSLLKTVVPILFREVVQRLLVVISILVYAAKWIDFEEFVFIYVALLSSVTLLMVLYILWLGHWSVGPSPKWRLKKLLKRMLVFGGYTLLGNISANTLYTVDGIMLAAYVGMNAVGIYTTSFYITALILIPWRAIQKVVSPLVAEHWRKGDTVAMARLYKRTSLINMFIGSYLFLVMIIGLDSLFSLMPQDFSDGRLVILIVGTSRLIDMITGLNGYIMITSKYYRMDLFFNVGLVVAAIILNAILIPAFGIVGAAAATAIALGISNVFRVAFLWVWLKMHPFSKEMLILGLVSILAFFAQLLLPANGNIYLVFLMKLVCFTVFFGIPIIFLRVIPDINKLLESVKRKIFR
jgi:O-antigen/teichoic acid export membrane protein